MVIAPCTGNTAAKLANSITDTAVTMAAKAVLRNCRPVLLAISTNDGLGMNAKNIGVLLNTRNVFFVPFGQDNPEHKPNSACSGHEFDHTGNDGCGLTSANAASSDRKNGEASKVGGNSSESSECCCFGSHGAVGRELLQNMEERQFPVKSLKVLASLDQQVKGSLQQPRAHCRGCWCRSV